jgi:hypothetical protein
MAVFASEQDLLNLSYLVLASAASWMRMVET